MPCSSTPLSSEAPTVAAFSALLARCASQASAASLHSFLLKSSRLFLSPFLVNRLAAAYSRLGSSSSAVVLFHDAPTKNLFSRNILLAALLQSRDLRSARRVFDQMPEKDTVSYNSMISGYLASGHSAKAFELVYTMRELGFSPSGFTFSIISSGVCSARQGMQVHATAIRHDLAFWNPVVGNSLIDMYKRVGIMEYAERVFWSMEELDVVSWNSVMLVYKDACSSGQVFECFWSMRGLGFLVDEFSVSTVLSVCTDFEDLAKD